MLLSTIFILLHCCYVVVIIAKVDFVMLVSMNYLVPDIELDIHSSSIMYSYLSYLHVFNGGITTIVIINMVFY